MAQAVRRRTVLGAAAVLAVSPLLHPARAAGLPAPPAPAAPLDVSVVDVAGNLALTQPAFEAYAKAKPELVGRFTFTKAPAPELPPKIRAQQAAGSIDIDLVLTGTDALAAGIDGGIWIDLLPAHADLLPNLADVLLPGAFRMQSLAQNQGVIVSFCPAGPLLEYMPDAVTSPPASTAELLDFTKQKPDRFMYARPANSGPGRAFLMGLPYLLGDKDPKDPVNGWDNTWSYLAELDKGIEYYPTGTGATMKELGEGSRDIIASMTGWDINPRALGIVPREARMSVLKGFHWINDGHYMCIPKGLAPDRLAVLLDVAAYMLSKPAQAFGWDDGYFYPGPAVKGVPLSMAPAKSQDVIKEFGRLEYAQLIDDTPNELPLEASQMVSAFRRWDEQIGSKKAR